MTMHYRNRLTLTAALAALTLGGLNALAAPDPITVALATPTRPAADAARDTTRKAAELLALARVRPAEQVADMMPGGGYFTRLFAALAGPKGHVYALVPTEFAERSERTRAGAEALAKDPALGNVSALVQPLAALATPQPLDLVWTSQNYHDVYNGFGAATAAAMDAAVFKALKPGGRFIVSDHAALAGTGVDAATPLHRIDPALVKAQVLAAGFVFDGASPVLANPADPKTAGVFDPAVRGKTDQFVFSFHKPG